MTISWLPPTLSFLAAGNAYAARRNSPDKSWQEAAYTDEIAEVSSGAVQACCEPPAGVLLLLKARGALRPLKPC